MGCNRDDRRDCVWRVRYRDDFHELAARWQRERRRGKQRDGINRPEGEDRLVDVGRSH
jgi:hypothetical protein